MSLMAPSGIFKCNPAKLGVFVRFAYLRHKQNAQRLTRSAGPTKDGDNFDPGTKSNAIEEIPA
jgi:hypothetical protein